VTRRIVQKYINALKEAGRIERVGGKRYGHWEFKTGLSIDVEA
jgi:hypothetical protein